MELRKENGELCGFAQIVRYFSERHELDEILRKKRGRVGPVLVQQAIVGVASGEFDRVPDLNDAFLQIVGYYESRCRRRIASMA